VAILGLVLDLWSKQWAFAAMGQGGRRSLIPRVLEFQTMLNPGALFGIGKGQTLFFIVASLLALALVLWMFAQNPPQRRFLQIALGGILAGALGNMYDRINVRLILQSGSPARGGPTTALYFQQIDDDGTTMTIQEFPLSAQSVPRQLTGTARAKAMRPHGYVRDFIKINTTAPDWNWIPQRWRGKELWPWVFNVADTLLVVGVSILAIHLWTERKHPLHAQSDSADDSTAPTA
jgi:signal peptidase II